MATLTEKLNIIALGRGVFQCDNCTKGTQYRVTQRRDGFWCSCPARVPCKHIAAVQNFLRTIQQPKTLPDLSFSGHVSSLRFKPAEQGYLLVLALQNSFLCELSAKSDSNFSRGVLSALSCLSPEQLRSPITVEHIPPNHTRVIQRGLVINGTGNDFIDWKATAKRALANVKAANQ
jgi:hypothetical protein